jgi:hypothetical protein
MSIDALDREFLISETHSTPAVCRRSGVLTGAVPEPR